MLDVLHASAGTFGTLAILLLGLVVVLFWAPGIAHLVTGSAPTWAKVTGVLALGLFPPLVLLLWGFWWTREALTCPPYLENCITPITRFGRWYRMTMGRLFSSS